MLPIHTYLYIPIYKYQLSGRRVSAWLEAVRERCQRERERCQRERGAKERDRGASESAARETPAEPLSAVDTDVCVDIRHVCVDIRLYLYPLSSRYRRMSTHTYAET